MGNVYELDVEIGQGHVPNAAKHRQGNLERLCIINVLGSFVLGLVCALVARHVNASPQLVLMLKVGLCGGFTTFSTFALETSDLLQAGAWPAALAYAAASVVLSVGAVFAAEALAG